MFLFSPIMMAGESGPTYPLDGLYNHWNGDNVVGTSLRDQSPIIARNGLMYGSIGTAPGYKGRTTLTFNGINQWVKFSQVGNGFTEFTIAIRYYSNGGAGVLFAKNSGTPCMWDILGTNASNFAEVSMGDSASTNLTFNSSPTAVTLGDSNWHSLMLTYSSGTGKLYLDGTLVNTQAFTWNRNRSQDDVSMGRRLNISGAYDWFDGGIQEVMCWNRELNSDERSQVEAYI